MVSLCSRLRRTRPRVGRINSQLKRRQAVSPSNGLQMPDGNKNSSICEEGYKLDTANRVGTVDGGEEDGIDRSEPVRD